MNKPRLAELLDITIIQKMADAHYSAAGMPIGIIDAIDGSILVGAGWQDICTKFHRANPECLNRCMESDRYISNHLHTGEACHYKCKNGLWDIGIPIEVGGNHLATMFLGQFFYEGEEPDRDFFKAQADTFGFDRKSYLGALDRVPVFSREKVSYILEYDKALAVFIADLAENALSKQQADEAIRDSERKFHVMFDQAYQFFGLLSTDGYVMKANMTSLQLLDIEECDVIGKPFWETPWWSHSPELQNKLRKAIRQAAEGHLVRFEATHPSAGGETIHVDFSIKPVTDDQGKVVLLIPEGRDISEHKRAEEQIKRQAEFLQLILDAMPYPVFYKDRQGRYLGCNRAFEELVGVTREEVAGKTVHELAPQEFADTYTESDRKLFANPGTQVYESRIQVGEGSLRDVIFHKATFQGPDGSLGGIVGAIIDVTERKQAEREKQKLEDQLILSQKMESIGRLAGGVAHDFNNMLSIILGNAELALDKIDGHHPLSGHLNEIQGAADRSVDLTRQLLAFARRQEVTPRALNLNKSVNHILTMLRRLVGEDIELAWRPARDLWTVKMDPAQVDQVLMNLAANSRDSITGVGTIAIETRNLIADEAYCALQVGLTPGEYVLMEFSDSGCGMDHHTLSKIFEPFYTTKGEGKGTGLGLATVYGIVKQNAGHIQAYSEPGQGTTFKICIPRCEDSHTGLRTPAETGDVAKGNETVLLVEDEAMLLKMAESMVRKLGYNVMAARTPGEAIRLAEAHPGKIHLLITDVVMPEMNGRELAVQVKTLYPELKCLYMSGYTANVISSRGVIEEGTHFLQKPFSVKSMANKIREALEAK